MRPLSSHLNGGVVRKAVVEGLVWHPQTGGGDLDDVLARDLPVRTHRDPEEGADPVVGVELPEDPVVVPAVEVEGPQDVPACNTPQSVSQSVSSSLTSQVVNDLHQRFLPVGLNVL